jgi:hypothetical protein
VHEIEQRKAAENADERERELEGEERREEAKPLGE